MITAQEKIQVLSLPMDDPESIDKLYEILFIYIGKIQNADQGIFSSYQAPRFHFLLQQLFLLLESQNSTSFIKKFKVKLNMRARGIDKILNDIFLAYKKRLTRQNKFRDSEAVNLLNKLEIELESIYPKIKEDYENFHPIRQLGALPSSHKNRISQLIQHVVSLIEIDNNLRPRKKAAAMKYLEKALQEFDAVDMEEELGGDRLSTEEKMAIVERLYGCAATDESAPMDEEVDQILFEGLMEKYK
ncbi:hypothetical protein [[Limnothrix rosea] IAM M-220]|uniref:hypothetical protein n=1 Tax=[Limnothrix rosea] IAM M-220 TaxID=454133 RepID=UPI00095E8348|nr:hypothetical protein [[Limnothrix rosea] IAM M-220]OKH18165.1 hypothetical protein NIES208_06470 [[Limnothrix rosea] IAM M-220]